MPNIAEFEDFIKTQGGNKGLAEKMGVAPATVSAWRTGRNKIDPQYKEQMKQDLEYQGRFPDEVPEYATQADVESLRQEVRKQARWLRNEMYRHIVGAVAAIQANSALPESPPDNQPGPSQP